MRKQIASLLGITIFAGFCLGTSKPKKSEPTDPTASTASTAASAFASALASALAASAASAPTATAKTAQAAAPDPAADYKSLDDVKMDGQKAVGKTALLRVRRGETQPDLFWAYPCEKVGGLNLLKINFEPAEQSLVRGIPTSLLAKQCARVHFKVTGKDFGGTIKGKVIAILDVDPVEAKAAPAGADFGAIDDINLAGDKANGKIAELGVWRGDTNDKRFVGYPCGGSGGGFFYVSYTADQKEAVKGISNSITKCQTVRIKLTGREYYSKTTWKASLLEVK